jgi:endonuclease YncB( thermonuclease family)
LPTHFNAEYFMIRATETIWILLVLLVVAVAADDPKPDVLKLSTPVLDEQSRTWTDSTETKAIVGTLLELRDGKFWIQRVDGERFGTTPDHLSVPDRAYATYATAPRVNPKSQVRIGKVVSIMDGDTIQIRTIGEENVTVRLIGIDAPEKGQDFGSAAKDFLGERIHEKTVRVEFTETDRYQRHLGDVYVVDIWLNYELAQNGLAWQREFYRWLTETLGDKS